MIDLTAVPGIALDRTLRQWRRPLEVGKAVLARDAGPDWGPTLAFERFEIAARERVGGLLHDERLLERARIQRQKLHQVERAAKLEAEAEAKSEHAEETLQQRRQAAEHRRQQAEEEADRREQALKTE